MASLSKLGRDRLIHVTNPYWGLLCTGHGAHAGDTHRALMFREPTLHFGKRTQVKQLHVVKTGVKEQWRWREMQEIRWHCGGKQASLEDSLSRSALGSISMIQHKAPSTCDLWPTAHRDVPFPKREVPVPAPALPLLPHLYSKYFITALVTL